MKKRLFNPFECVRFVCALIACVWLLGLCSGCITEQGSRTVVGNHFALPTFSSAGDEIDCKIYESVEGAVVTTRKNCLVEIAYLNSYTNNICGVWDKVGEMKLTVKVEPLSDSSASSASGAQEAGN